MLTSGLAPASHVIGRTELIGLGPDGIGEFPQRVVGVDPLAVVHVGVAHPLQHQGMTEVTEARQQGGVAEAQHAEAGADDRRGGLPRRQVHLDHLRATACELGHGIVNPLDEIGTDHGHLDHADRVERVERRLDDRCRWDLG